MTGEMAVRFGRFRQTLDEALRYGPNNALEQSYDEFRRWFMQNAKPSVVDHRRPKRGPLEELLQAPTLESWLASTDGRHQQRLAQVARTIEREVEAAILMA